MATVSVTAISFCLLMPREPSDGGIRVKVDERFHPVSGSFAAKFTSRLIFLRFSGVLSSTRDIFLRVSDVFDFDREQAGQ
ncbi:hypothetical protein C479_14068 [Halovivax asiaticus JCM 14624]|uniref:Uncharacterized protein n=1 Tax=Halovivax asiaticus JCM 14624 TaxID=1227490 RepID=M0BC34_9EURY|nr:hypothetical protein C479_14068 [Halovivax asiaticus JCM 14624]